MGSETRYMRTGTQLVNGLTAYVLDTTAGTPPDYIEVYKRAQGLYSTKYVYWGIRVWKRASDGTETEITSGSPVAVVERNTDAEGMQSNTWNCPETSLETTDAIVVRVYINVADLGWGSAVANFITAQLGASKLDAATWTVYYWTKRVWQSANAYLWGYYRWGDTNYNSRIENFTWSAPPPPPPPAPAGVFYNNFFINYIFYLSYLQKRKVRKRKIIATLI
jgi:hypothetical protein